MPVIFEPILSIFTVIGFYFIGRFISLKLQFDKILNFVSNPHYQFTIIGIIFFLYFLFPFFLLGVLPKEIFYLFYFVSFYGLLNTLINYKKIYSSANKKARILKQTNKSNLVIFFTLTALLSLTGLDFITSISGAATSISNVGPGLGNIIGPNGDFSSLPDISKWILTLGMILGRLELFAILVLFLPSFWRS